MDCGIVKPEVFKNLQGWKYSTHSDKIIIITKLLYGLTTADFLCIDPRLFSC